MKIIQKSDNTAEDNLCDINNVEIRQDLPRDERIKDFIHQIKNPYCFLCGDVVVEVEYSTNGVSIDDCLREYLQGQE